MISEILGGIAQWVLNLIDAMGYLGIFIVMVLESSLVPIPSEMVMPFAGYLVSQGEMNFWVASIVGGLGNLVGSLIAYYIGRVIPEKQIVKFLEKFGRFILVSPKEYYNASNWLKKNGPAVSFFSRLIPGVRTLISIPAGVSKIDIKQFALYTFFGGTLWCFFLTYVGLKLGENWEQVSGFIGQFETAVLIIGIALIVLYVWKNLSDFKTTKKVK